jgi:uncharacterized protein YndB with AHSA1/START domain
MNILIIVVLVIAGLIALLLIVALFIRKEYAIERQITIGTSRQNVFDYIKYLKNQDHYSKWVMMDPNARKTFKGTDATVGFVSAWDSDNKHVGKGEQEIKRIKEGERIDIEIRFEKPFKSVSPAYMITETLSDNASKVRWGFVGKMAYPMNVMLLFINLPELLGKDLEISLTNLKTQLEKGN